MKLVFANDMEREARGHVFTPAKWLKMDPKDPTTLASYFRPRKGARKAPVGDKVRVPKDDFGFMTEPWDDGRLRELSWEPDAKGLKTVEKVLDYAGQCQTTDVSWVSEELRTAATEIVKAAAHDSATSYHYESIEGDYELFDAFEADWLTSQTEPGRRWTRMGLQILTNFLRRIEEDGNEFEVPDKTIADAKMFCEQVGIDEDDQLGPTLFDFYC